MDSLTQLTPHCQQRPSVALLTGTLLAVVASCATPSAAQAVADLKPAFNELTYVLVDENGQSFRLFGRDNPAGPRQQIPYAQILASAIVIPADRGTPPWSRESVPGFSLDLTDDTLAKLPSLTARMNDRDESDRAMGAYYGNEAVWRRFLEASTRQAWPDIREQLKRYLYRKLGRDEADAIVNAINSVDDLMATFDRLMHEKILLAEDRTSLIEQGVGRFQGKVGNIFFYPEGTTEALYGAEVFSSPKFIGIPRDTQFGRIVLDADLALKSLLRSVELKDRFPFHQTWLEWELRHSTTSQMAASVGDIRAAQTYPKTLTVQISSDGRALSFQHAEMAIRVGPYDPDQTPSQTEVTYADFLSGHYDEYAQAFPALWDLRELVKVLAAARYLKSSNVRVYIPIEHSWTAPSRVKGIWLAGSLGAGGKNLYLVSTFTGGISLQLQTRLQTTVLPPDIVERFRRAADQLVAVHDTEDSGICYDGRTGCRAASSLGTIRIDAPPPGSAAISQATLARMRVDPAAKALLDNEESATTTLTEATTAVHEKEAALANATSSEKGRLQVELVAARQAETNAKSVLRTEQIKVSDAARVIEEVELVESAPPRRQ